MQKTDNKVTLQNWFHKWLFEYRINDSRPSTLERYEGIYRNYIKDSEIGAIKLKDLRPVHIQTFYNKLIKDKGKTPDTIRTINKILKCALNQALKEYNLQNNCCNYVILPKIESKKEIDTFTADEQKLFLKAIENHKYKTILILALLSGLRIGELIALKWCDIDFKNNELKVRRTLKRVKKLNNSDTIKTELKRTEVVEQLPKTKSGIRSVSIPSFVMIELKRHRIRNSESYITNDYVFLNDAGQPLDSRNLSREYRKILATAGIPYRKFHSLRHTYATMLHDEGEDLFTISKLLGHSNTSITSNIYTHLTPESKSRAADKLNKRFGL